MAQKILKVYYSLMIDDDVFQPQLLMSRTSKYTY